MRRRSSRISGRPASGVEVGYYVAIAEAGLSPSQIAQGASAVSQASWNQIAADFTASPEFSAVHGGGSIVIDLYHTILGREPSAAETAYYDTQLKAGLPTSLLLQEFVNSPEYQNKVNPAIKQALIVFGSGVASGQDSPTPTPLDVKTGEIGLVGMHSHHAPISFG